MTELSDVSRNCDFEELIEELMEHILLHFKYLTHQGRM